MKKISWIGTGLDVIAIFIAEWFLYKGYSRIAVLSLLGGFVVAVGLWMTYHNEEVNVKGTIFKHPVMKIIGYPALLFYGIWEMIHAFPH